MNETFDGCRLERFSRMARLTLARPPLHVIDAALLGELHRALERVESEEDVPCLVVTADGERAFSVGVEVRDHFPDRLDEMLELFHSFCRRLLALDAVTVGAVRGLALGGAMELLACCDFVVASESAVFGQPEIDLACFPPLAAALYPSLFGAKRASEIVLLGERFSAAQAKDLGLVYRVVPENELDAAVESLVGKLADKSPAALRLTKKALRVPIQRALEDLGSIEAIYKEELAATEDMLEGLKAFLEKRRPVWKGR